MRQDEVLYRIADRVKNFAVLYVCDLDQVPDFKQMYELYDPVTLMFFFRNKHMVCTIVHLFIPTPQLCMRRDDGANAASVCVGNRCAISERGTIIS